MAVEGMNAGTAQRMEAAKASSEDLDCIEKVKDAGALLGVPVLDFIICGRDTYFSAREQKIL